MKASIMLAVVVAVIVGVNEAKRTPCTSYYCSKFCGSAGCSDYQCYRTYPGKICYCLHCSRAESPFSHTESDRNVNEKDDSQMMNEIEIL